MPSDAELRIAQAQLVGWLEGLFHGIQTALVAQQMAAQAQLQQMRQLPPGHQSRRAERRDVAPAAPAGRGPVTPRAPASTSRPSVGPSQGRTARAMKHCATRLRTCASATSGSAKTSSRARATPSPASTTRFAASRIAPVRSYAHDPGLLVEPGGDAARCVVPSARRRMDEHRPDLPPGPVDGERRVADEEEVLPGVLRRRQQRSWLPPSTSTKGSARCPEESRPVERMPSSSRASMARTRNVVMVGKRAGAAVV